MKNKEFNQLCDLLLNRLPLDSNNLIIKIYSSWQLKITLSAHQIYRPSIMKIGNLYHQYQKNKYEKLIEQLPANCDASLLEFYIEKYEAHDFATKYGRAYKKEYRDWCLEKARDESISPVHLPFLIWNGDLNPRNKSFLKGTKLTIFVQSFLNIIFSLIMANGLLLTYLSDTKPLLLRLQVALTIVLVMLLGWAFYNPYSIDLYRVTKNYSKRNY